MPTEIDSRIIPPLPTEIIAEILSFIPQVINKYSRVECLDPIKKIRIKRANVLDKHLCDFFRLEPETNSPVDYDFLNQAVSLNLFETLSAISLCFLIDAGGWTKSSIPEYEIFSPWFFFGPRTRLSHCATQIYTKPYMLIRRVHKKLYPNVYALI